MHLGDLVADPRGDAWQHYSVSTLADGCALVLVKTNDDNDDGYDDGRVVEWKASFPSLKAALHYTGKSRLGISGIRVHVTVDGERV